MSVFVDTGVFYAHHDRDADRHEAAVAGFDEVLDGAYGQPYTSDYVLDEAVTLTRARTDSFEAADSLARRILGTDPYPPVVELLYTGPDDVGDALDAYRRYADQNLSFTDAMTVAVCESRGIDTVLSFDADFDGVVERTVPSG